MAVTFLVSCGQSEPRAAEPAPARVLVGLDVIEHPERHPELFLYRTKEGETVTSDGPSQPAGPVFTGRIGLVAHAASRNQNGDHAIEVFERIEERARTSGHDFELVRLFSPEHGLLSAAAAGESVADGEVPGSDLPVVSLYGEKKRPAPEDLADLDVLVFDLQGAGVRFYTYVSTLIHCLEAAHEAGVEFVVLDRPNPLGGARVQGPYSAPRDVVPSSFVNLAPGPLAFGLTKGEMARQMAFWTWQTTKGVRVIPMVGWERSMTFEDTGLEWIPPSPNLRTAEAAIAYPGTALLEGTNVSEGRGTEAPFLYLGAPFLTPEFVNQRLLTIEVPGFALEPATFVPKSSPAAPEPKHLDETCHGVRVRVTDGSLAEGYRLGVELLVALQEHPEFELRRGGEALTWLVGTDELASDLRAGKTASESWPREKPSMRAGSSGGAARCFIGDSSPETAPPFPAGESSSVRLAATLRRREPRRPSARSPCRSQSWVGAAGFG